MINAEHQRIGLSLVRASGVTPVNMSAAQRERLTMVLCEMRPLFQSHLFGLPKSPRKNKVSSKTFLQ